MCSIIIIIPSHTALYHQSWQLLYTGLGSWRKKIIHTDTNKQWKQTTSIVYLNLYVDNVYMVYVSYNNDDATHVVRLTSAVE